jgi:serine/threonine protein kinase
VAVKIVRPDRVADEGSLGRLRAEVDILDHLSHPGIVRAFDAVLDGPRPHVVLEFLDGPRLSTLIGRRGVAPERLLPLGLAMCSALHYMAARGVLHLDVKPRNIILAGPPRLIDLSVARRVDEIPAITSPIGTDAYMAPEQCAPGRFSEIGPPADVWGLGITLYEALTGRHPFAEARRAGLRYPQLEAAPAPLPGRRRVPPLLADAVMSCMEPDPASRPAAGELARTLGPMADPPPRRRLSSLRRGSGRPG